MAAMLPSSLSSGTVPEDIFVEDPLAFLEQLENNSRCSRSSVKEDKSPPVSWGTPSRSQDVFSPKSAVPQAPRSPLLRSLFIGPEGQGSAPS